ncbi:MAG TPA: hypothetical protein VGD43_24625 [Micromonospora sp.]
MSAPRCERCAGAMPLVHRRHARYCSSACRKAASRERRASTGREPARGVHVGRCPVCGVTWDAADSRPEKVYCSARCRARSWRRRLAAGLAQARDRVRRSRGGPVPGR